MLVFDEQLSGQLQEQGWDFGFRYFIYFDRGGRVCASQVLRPGTIESLVCEPSAIGETSLRGAQFLVTKKSAGLMEALHNSCFSKSSGVFSGASAVYCW
jgi:hypothetical protein